MRRGVLCRDQPLGHENRTADDERASRLATGTPEGGPDGAQEDAHREERLRPEEVEAVPGQGIRTGQPPGAEAKASVVSGQIEHPSHESTVVQRDRQGEDHDTSQRDRKAQDDRS